VAEQLLHGADVVTVLDQMSRKRMALMPGPALETLCRVPDYAECEPASRIILGISLE